MPKSSLLYNICLVFALTSLSSCGGGGGGNAPPGSEEASLWLIPAGQIVDAGPGQDGIPAISDPVFESAASSTLDGDEYVIGLVRNGVARAYPHEIMDWHEIVNDEFGADPVTISYCPLTGSALAWLVDSSQPDVTFGVSGLLHNSNLLLYDRASRSLWSQILELSVNGPRVGDEPNKTQVVETTFATWKEMYPTSEILSRTTGFRRDYGNYPYDDYKTSSGLLFPVANADTRMHPKRRVHAVRVEGVDRVYQIDSFATDTEALNEQIGDTEIVVVGNSQKDFAVSYERKLDDGTVLQFSPLQGQLPNVMTDTEGTTWNIFGTATSGPRAGSQLQRTTSMTVYWFAWVAYYDSTEIHFN